MILFYILIFFLKNFIKDYINFSAKINQYMHFSEKIRKFGKKKFFFMFKAFSCDTALNADAAVYVIQTIL
jgi:hypothetical protein